MKKINSINIAHRVVGAAFFFVAALPAALLWLGGAVHFERLRIAAGASLIVGVLIVAFLIVMLSVELHQDRRIEKRYRETRNSRLPIAGGRCECQACGGRQTGHTGGYCTVCGATLGANFKKGDELHGKDQHG